MAMRAIEQVSCLKKKAAFALSASTDTARYEP
jgi:hypothetical protein